MLALLAQDLATDQACPRNGERSLLELEGLGAGIWEGIDAQEYVEQLRREWGNRL